MHAKTKKFCHDILISIDSIFDYVGDKRDFNDYLNNKLLRRAVEREIEIIGEAMNSILLLNPELEIENARKVVDTRNFVIHGYDKVDNVIIWGIINNHLPKLRKDISDLLNRL